MKVKVYTTSTCPYCDKTIEFLKSHKVEFDTITVDELAGREQEEAIAWAYRLSGQRRFPVTDIDGATVIGFDIVRLKGLLGIKEEAGLHQAMTVKVSANEEKAMERLRAEARQTGYILHPDEEMVSAIVSGLLKNEARYGYRSCPCRLATGDYNKDCDIICPCAYRDWDLDTYGMCLCSLYMTEDFIKSGAKIVPIPDSRERIPALRPKEGKKGEVCEILNAPFKPDIKEVVKVFSYTLGKEERDALKEELEMVAGKIGIERIAWHGETAEGSREMEDGGKVSLRFLQGMEGYVYLFKVFRGSKDTVDSEALNICTESMRGRPNELYHLDIFVGTPSHDLLAGKVKGQRLKDGTIVLSGYEPKEMVRKYIVNPKTDSDADRVIEDIVRLETCYNLLLSQRQKYLLLADQLSRLEERIATKMGVINLNILKAVGETLKGWLHCLSVNFGEVSGVAAELKRHAADTEGRRNVLQAILDRWAGEPVEGLQTISEPLYFYTKAVGDDYGRLAQRVEGIRREMGDVITILRTRVDLIQQEQSLEIQKSMHETAKTQLRMQRAVESLEVFIVTYYMTVLAKIAFDALEAQGRHLPDKPIVLAGYLIPVFFAAAIFISGKMGHILESLRNRFRGKRHE